MFSTILAAGLLSLVAARPTQLKERADSSCSYWLEDISHQALVAFNSDPSSYAIYRNVMDYGATGDGTTDDTAAIQSAIADGSRCAPGSCLSSTTTPALVYFPSGTYLISAPIQDYYYTQLVGNPNCVPTIKASANFTGGTGLIDGDPYESTGDLAWAAVNVFYRQIRNFIIDTTSIAASTGAVGIHWPTAQATSLQNIEFLLSSESGTQHQGVFIENGSGGLLVDLVFNGGLTGLSVGNQQFTSRNLTFNNCVTAINQFWDWGWVYQGITIDNCGTGLDLSSASVGSVIFKDSVISNTPVGISVASAPSSSSTENTLIVENVSLTNVTTAIEGSSGTLLSGSTGSTTIASWGQGNSYDPSGPTAFQGTFTANSISSSLLSGSDVYTLSKPQYETLSSSSFVSARSSGAKGDGTTDDTAALNSAISTATSEGLVLFLDHGDYLVTGTITIPAGAKIVGEGYPVILSSGDYFSDMSSPKPVVQVGSSGDSGTVELSDFIVSTQGAQAGAILIEFNLASSGTPSGLWDVHTRIGGFAGSDLQASECAKDTSTTTPNTDCIAAFMSIHITSSASGVYLENTWFWTADHDIDDADLTQTTIYAGRGMLDQSTGPVWLISTAVEHHTMYQYQFSSASEVYAAQLQTETAYYQPNPVAPSPFTVSSTYDDPSFSGDYATSNGWGLRIHESSDLFIYGAGHYSFVSDWSSTCESTGNDTCQDRIVSIESSSGINLYNLNTVAVGAMITVDGTDVALASDNPNSFTATIAKFVSS